MEEIRPQASSRTLTERRPPKAMHQGDNPEMSFTTRRSESRKITSIGNFIKNVWMARQDGIQSPSPGARASRPISPTILDKRPSATKSFSANIVPCVWLIAFMSEYPKKNVFMGKKRFTVPFVRKPGEGTGNLLFYPALGDEVRNHKNLPLL